MVRSYPVFAEVLPTKDLLMKKTQRTCLKTLNTTWLTFSSMLAYSKTTPLLLALIFPKTGPYFTTTEVCLFAACRKLTEHMLKHEMVFFSLTDRGSRGAPPDSIRILLLPTAGHYRMTARATNCGRLTNRSYNWRAQLGTIGGGGGGSRCAIFGACA